MFKYFSFQYLKFVFLSDDEILPAVESGNLDILKLFLEAREDKNPVISIIDGDEKSVLLIAAAFGHLNIIVYYKDVLKFIDINPENNNGKTPLGYASVERHLHVAEYYMENGYKASGNVSTLYIVQ